MVCTSSPAGPEYPAGQWNTLVNFQWTELQSAGQFSTDSNIVFGLQICDRTEDFA
jgi:hypothetical protein